MLHVLQRIQNLFVTASRAGAPSANTVLCTVTLPLHPAANLQHLQPMAILRTSRKLVSSEKRPLVVMPSQVPPRRRSLPASTWGCCSQKWAGAVGLHEQPSCEHLVEAMGNAWMPCATLGRTRHG